MKRLSTVLVLLALQACLPGISFGQTNREGAQPPPTSRYLRAVYRHLKFVTRRSLDRYGPARTDMWLATIDTKTGGLPGEPLPPRLRWYRQITSPKGSNFYWDQPNILAAYQLSRLTGDTDFAERADAYIHAFLQRCVAKNSGLYFWGNHLYYDVIRDDISSFTGGYHECRPHTPAWELLWNRDPVATEKAIRAMAAAHVKDRSTGLFCRHANPLVKPGEFAAQEVQQAKPFLEAGATLIDSLCWLAERTEEDPEELIETALRVAHYSFRHRDESTGLMRNQPIDRRWDYHASTTEVGLWAGSLVRAAKSTGDREFSQIAQAAMIPWLRFGFDETQGKYYGRLEVASGRFQPPESPRGWVPPLYAEVFDIHERPTHNYPMPMAEACLSLYATTRSDLFRSAADRWVEHVRHSLPANEGRGAYAEDYGRVIHFLVRAAAVLKRPDCLKLADTVANEALEHLYLPSRGVFRSHPGEDRCDTVDGPGLLLLALLYLETQETPETAFGW